MLQPSKARQDVDSVVEELPTSYLLLLPPLVGQVSSLIPLAYRTLETAKVSNSSQASA
jgi:hypothetical protein